MLSPSQKSHSKTAGLESMANSQPREAETVLLLGFKGTLDHQWVVTGVREGGNMQLTGRKPSSSRSPNY